MTPQEIKDELIKLGFTESTECVYKKIGDYEFIYLLQGSFDVYSLKNQETINIELITIDRIKALIFGIVGTII